MLQLLSFMGPKSLFCMVWYAVLFCLVDLLCLNVCGTESERTFRYLVEIHCDQSPFKCTLHSHEFQNRGIQHY